MVGLSPAVRTFAISTSGCHRAGWDLHTSGYSVYVSDSDPQNTFEPYGYMNSYAGAHDIVASAYNNDYSSRNRVFLPGVHS